MKRRIVIAYLGSKCSCPVDNCWHDGPCNVKDIRCLQLDHINGGGCQESKVAGPAAMIDRYYRSPDLAKFRLQVLCANCNWVKRYVRKEVSGGVGVPNLADTPVAEDVVKLQDSGALV